MSDKDLKAIERIKAEIEKIDKNESKISFFVLDTKGVASGSLEYIYKLAYILNEHGYDVTMLYQTEKDEEFVGVGAWLPEKYANLKHIDINNDFDVSPADIIFIPEIFANVMNQTKKLPCKRIAILQNYDYMVEQTPFAAQWGDFGILDAITNTSNNEKLLNDVFPYVKTKVVHPYIDEMFESSISPKKMIINVVAKDQSDINRIIKPFYWKYQTFKWVSFRDLRNFTKANFAQALREGVATIWVDDSTSFGYSAVEAMKSGSIVIAKVPDEQIEWSVDENGKLKDCCIWFDNFNNVQDAIASVIRSYVTDKVPDAIYEEAKKVPEPYQKERTEKEILDYVKEILQRRKNEMEELIKMVENKEVKTDK